MQCEGYQRRGGAFTLGPVIWEQCTNEATVNIKFRQDVEEVKTLPACNNCWNECIESDNITIISVDPIGG